MKKLCLAVACVLLIAVAIVAPHRVLAKTSYANVTSPASPQGGSVITCSSNNGGRNFCPADTRGGVQLINQRSDARCVFGQTWGFGSRNIWVDRGCRADFQANYYGPGIPGFPGYPPGGGSYGIYCSSDTSRRVSCPTDVSGGVTLARQRSDAPCIYGSTWGYDRRGIWVDRGCRADFRIGGNNWAPPVRPGVTVVTCSSNDGRRNFCAANARAGVRLLRQRSDADCVYGQTWGNDGRQIWVDRGCRADFEVGNGR